MGVVPRIADDDIRPGIQVCIPGRIFMFITVIRPGRKGGKEHGVFNRVPRETKEISELLGTGRSRSKGKSQRSSAYVIRDMGTVAFVILEKRRSASVCL